MKEITICNVNICSFGNTLSGGEKFSYEVIPRLAKKYSTINYFSYNSLDEEWQKSYIRRFDDNFNLTKKDILIDIGTGSGYIAVEMAKRGINVIACDLTLKELVKLKKVIEAENLQNNLFLVCCSAENLPFKNKIANCVVSNAVLEHLPRELDAIREINRVCKLKGGLMITVPLNYKYLNPFFFPINYIHDLRIGHLRRYNKEILGKKFASWGLLNVYYTGHFLKVIKTLINHFVKIFDENLIEKDDKKHKNKKWGGSNIIVMFKNNRKI